MTDHLFKLNNVIQNYAWGSRSSIQQLFDIPNPSNQPQAEMWMGAHPQGCSRDQHGKMLAPIIAEDPSAVLGSYTAIRYGSLPYLLKILAAEKPLSIQVHPNKSKAKEGFERENAQGIPLDSSSRNYKDDNHKPELVYAITFYQAMNGFREINEIVSLFEDAQCDTLASALILLKAHPCPEQLQSFFEFVMKMNEIDKKQCLSELLNRIDVKAKSLKGKEAFQLVSKLHADYPGDIGLFSPLLLNIIELEPGEAMFLDAGTPHAYIHGTGIEIMANSDNVLRVGLTPKHIDVDELIKNTEFKPTPLNRLKLKPQNIGHRQVFNVPVDDFNFEVHQVSQDSCDMFVRSPEILLCLEGNMAISTKNCTIELALGESAFVCGSALRYQCRGNGKLVRAFN